MLYDREFYDTIRETSRRSAETIVPMVIALTGRVGSVVDFGCGTGAWLSVFRQHGAERILGLDGDHVEVTRLDIPQERFRPTALDRPVDLGERFDLAMSMEVAEHLPKQRADGLVDELTAAAPVVLFSAATPGQGGDGHVNECWQHVWAEAFEARGYLTIDAIRPAIWANGDVSWWYAQNLLLFASQEACAMRPDLASAARATDKRMISVVHPRCFGARYNFFRGILHEQAERIQQLERASGDSAGG